MRTRRTMMTTDDRRRAVCIQEGESSCYILAVNKETNRKRSKSFAIRNVSFALSVLFKAIGTSDLSRHKIQIKKKKKIIHWKLGTIVIVDILDSMLGPLHIPYIDIIYSINFVANEVYFNSAFYSLSLSLSCETIYSPFSSLHRFDYATTHIVREKNTRRRFNYHYSFLHRPPSIVRPPSPQSPKPKPNYS